MEKEFILTKEQWKSFYNIIDSSESLTRGNHHYHLNEDISSFFVKNSTHPKIKIDLNHYFLKNSPLIKEIIELHNNKFREEKLSLSEIENNHKIEKSLINDYLDCLTPLNLYEVKNELLNFTSLTNAHLSQKSFDAFDFLENNGLKLEDYLGEFLESSTTSSLRFSGRVISKLWFNFHDKNKTRPNQEHSLLLIKSLHPAENVLIMDDIERSSYYLSQIEKTQDTLDYLISLVDRSKNASMFKAIHKIVKKYPPELYNTVKAIFEDKNSIQTTISHLEIVQYKIEPLSLNLSGYLKASEVNNFFMSFNDAINSFMKKHFPNVKRFEKTKDHEFNFVTDNAEDKKNVTDFVNNLDSTFQYLLASYDKKQAPVKNTPLIIEAMEKVLFQIKLDDSLDNKKVISQKRKI